MPTTLTITVKYANGTIETFTVCVISTDTDTKLVFTGTLTGDSESGTHTIFLGPGMRVTKKNV